MVSMSTDVAPAWSLTRRATFQPKRTDNLRPEAVQLIGLTMGWRGLWRISEEDGGPYAGQVAWQPVDETARLGWVPDEDLVDAEA